MTDADKERERFLIKVGQIAPKPKAEPKAQTKPTKKETEQPNGSSTEH
jgi:hypothetical protein